MPACVAIFLLERDALKSDKQSGNFTKCRHLPRSVEIFGISSSTQVSVEALVHLFFLYTQVQIIEYAEYKKNIFLLLLAF